MSPALLPFLLGQANVPGAIPHLAKDELAVVSEGGGQLGYRGRLVVRTDGTVVFTSSRLDGPAKTSRFRLSKDELATLRRLIADTDFPALHKGPHAPNPPSAVDGIDRGLAVRKGVTVRGWSNTVWLPPVSPVPLFDRFQELTDRARPSA